LGGFSKNIEKYTFLLLIDPGAQGSLYASLPFRNKKSDPKSDQIYLLKIAVEILGVNPPFGWEANFAPTCISGSDYRIETI